MNKRIIPIHDAPKVPGLTFRVLNGQEDSERMASIILTSNEFDGQESVVDAEEVRRWYESSSRFDVQRDALCAEIDGELAAFGRVRWRDRSDGVRRFDLAAFVHPAWRGRGIGRALLRWLERRSGEISGALPAASGGSILNITAQQSQAALHAIARAAGYEPLRYERYMRRDLVEPIPDAPLPAGFEFRAATAANYRTIWEADDRGFEDHWGHAPGTEEDYQAWLQRRTFQPELWRVIWHIESDRVAAQVLNFFDQKENERFGRLRGYTESITTQKEFRRMGLARAALCASMHMFRSMGFTETYLGTDSQNLSGSYRVYEWCGYRTTNLETTYSKNIASAVAG
jgi:ribosomal protein S18 acetylase RimI-like enzyme